MEVDTARGIWSDYGEKPRNLKYFGLAMEDVNRDGFPDIISGRYWYKNPGKDITDKWDRSEFGINIDASLTLDVDGDEYIDIIGEALPLVYWIEALDKYGNEWDTVMIGRIPPERHRNGQGFRVADVYKGGKKEILLAALGGIYCFEVPSNPANGQWPVSLVAETGSSEGFDVFDIDGDGDIDLIAGDMLQDTVIDSPAKAKRKKADPVVVKLYENPGIREVQWMSRDIGRTVHAIDRIEIADINLDGLPDFVISEERFPGLEQDAHLFWFKGILNSDSLYWERFLITRQYSLNNLDVGDIDKDGDVDIVTAEHKGPDLKTLVFENDGYGSFTMILVDKGKESHLGTQLKDMDMDGDLDIVSITWDKPKYLHLWRNEGINKNR